MSSRCVRRTRSSFGSLLQLGEAGQPVVGIPAARQAGAARVGASAASRPAGLAGGIDLRAGREPADAVVVVAVQAGGLGGTAPSDAFLVVERAARVFALHHLGGFRG